MEGPVDCCDKRGTSIDPPLGTAAPMPGHSARADESRSASRRAEESKPLEAEVRMRGTCFSAIAVAYWVLGFAPLGVAFASEPVPAPVVEVVEDAIDPDEPDKDELPPVVPRPDFMRNKPYIPDLLLKDKREGRYVTFIPAIGWDAEEGFTLGGMAQIFNNGARDDPFFRTAPYRSKLFVGGVVTSEEILRLFTRLDIPYLRDSPYRFRIDAALEKNDVNNYFGLGDDGLDLVSPISPFEEYVEFDDYQDDLDRILDPTDPEYPTEGECEGAEGGPCTFTRYNKFMSRDIIAVVSLERDLLGGLLRPLLGLQVRYIDIDDYTGERVEPIGGGSKATSATTKLREDHDAGLIEGFDGGWDNYIKLGLAYDSRNFEPNPSRGIFAEVVAAFSSEILGSDYNYQRATFSASFFHDFLAERETVQQLIFATRGTYNMQFGNTPFFELARLGFSDYDRRGVGGFQTLRGYKLNRFVGRSAAVLSGEMRWFFAEKYLWGQHLKPGLAIFGEGGRSFDDVELHFRDWKGGFGVGFRLAWNLATLVSFDFGVSREDSIFYLELGTQF
jgi:hypothetical protein